MTNVQAANLALIQIGAKTINDLSDTSDSNAVVANTLFQPTLNEVLMIHEWNSATKRAQLSSLSETIYAPWDYVYSLPTDYLKFQCVLDDDGVYDDLIDDPYMIENSKFYTDRDSVYIKYTHDEDDVSNLDEWVVNAFIAYLAHKLVTRLTENPQKKGETMQQFSAVLVEAMRMEAEAREPRIEPATRWEDIG